MRIERFVLPNPPSDPPSFLLTIERNFFVNAAAK
uniref:Uncharacterized protein n=1 Tax=Parascaris equorum TaxID=6256 RepID=A0A914S5Z4_PAREQ